jgi:hypothetical protein
MSVRPAGGGYIVLAGWFRGCMRPKRSCHAFARLALVRRTHIYAAPQ